MSIISPIRSRRISRRRAARDIVISDERALLLDQGGGIKKALPLIGDDPFFVCNTDAFWIDAAQLQHSRARRSLRPRR